MSPDDGKAAADAQRFDVIQRFHATIHEDLAAHCDVCWLIAKVLALEETR